MKRLLAYLFIVLGLGLVFNIKANAEVENYICKNEYKSYIYKLDLNNKWITIDNGPKKELTFINDKKVIFRLGKYFKLSFYYGSTGYVRNTSYIEHSEDQATKGNYLKCNKTETQIAKVEPSQTQEVAGEKERNVKIDMCIIQYQNQNHGAAYFKDSIYTDSYCEEKKIAYKDFIQSIYPRVLCVRKSNPALNWNSKSCNELGLSWTEVKYDGKNFYYDPNETQIAKKEPSQTQEVVKKASKTSDHIDLGVLTDTYYLDFLKSGKCDYTGFWYKFTTCSWFKKENVLHYTLNDTTISKVDRYLMGEYSFNLNQKQDKFIVSNNISRKVIAQWGSEKKILTIKVYKEPTIKPKKKVEVAKVEEPKQEEFKPEDKDIDNDAPVIQIAEAITVDSQTYTLKGKVKDKSRLYLTIDGRPIKVSKNGEFEFEGFAIDPEEGEVLKIVAIDRWKNRSEKDVKINVDLKATTVARTYERLKPYAVRVDKNNNKIAIIIGIENYKNMTKCNYCNRDANAFRAYATNALGVKSSNIISLIDEKATRGEILKAFKLSLPQIAREGNDIILFFAGHGLASEDGQLFIIPQDGDQRLLSDTGISRVELVKLIKKVNPKSVNMFFDACYSGQTRGEQMLVASLRGIKVLPLDDVPNNFSIFNASTSDQGSSHIEEAKHGMFSYYLMKGLEGKADENKDYKITNGELIAYLKTNVSKEAFTQNREQDPMLSGDPDQVLMSYR